MILTTIAVSISVFICLLLDERPLFHVSVKEWHWKAFPYFILLGIIAGMNAVYLTKTVLFIKEKFNLTPKGIIEYLNLKAPIYTKTTNYGHFGKKELSWENVIKM